MNTPTVHLACILLLVGLFAGCGTTIPVPKSYAQLHAKDGTFCVDYPEGWTAEKGGRPDGSIQWAKAYFGNAKARVDATFEDSVIGDIVSMGGGSAILGGEEPYDEESPQAVIHARHIKTYEETLPGYRERNPTAIRVSLGDAIRTEFVCRPGMVKMHGYRATVLTSKRSVTFLAYGPDSQWDTLEPIFDKMMRSLKRGAAGM